jgi:hypothetical protein
VLERRDVDGRAAIVSVRRTVSEDEVVELGKTSKSRRQVPLSRRALVALDRLPPRIDTPLLFPSPRGDVLHLSNFRRREWLPAVTASGRRPASANLRPALDVRLERARCRRHRLRARARDGNVRRDD